MRSLFATLRSLVIPGGAGPNSDRIEIGGNLPADLVAYYASFGVTLIGGTIGFDPPDGYQYDVFGVGPGTGSVHAVGLQNADGIAETWRIAGSVAFPAHHSLLQFGRAGSTTQIDVHGGSSINVQDAGDITFTESSLIVMSDGSRLITTDTADSCLIDNAWTWQTGSVLDMFGTLTVKSGAALTADSGSGTDINGSVVIPQLRHVIDEENTTSTRALTTYANMTNIAGCAFTAPLSGIVTIHYLSTLLNDNAGGGAAMVPWVGTGTTVGSGTEVLASTDANAISYNTAIAGEGVRFSGHKTVTGLTPGNSYNVSMRVRAITAGTASFINTHVTVVPSP